MVKERIEELKISPYVFPLLKYSPIEKPTVDKILTIVAKEYLISVENMLVRDRFRTIIEPRQLCMYILREQLQLSWREISNSIGGGYDHTTIISGYRRAKGLLTTCDKTKKRYRNILEML